MNKTILTILSFILIFKISAQENFQSARVFNINNDTISGFIDVYKWVKNPKVIKFKAHEEGKVSLLTPKEISGFEVSGQYFFGAAVQKEMSPLRMDILDNSAELELENDTLFLKALILGDKSLFMLNGENSKSLFYIQVIPNKFDLLLFKKYRKITQEEDVTVLINTYIGQLSLYLSNCPEIQKYLDGAQYQESYLMRIFRSYYACTASEIDYEVAKEKMEWKFGVLVGSSHNFLSTQAPISSLNFHLNDLSFDPSNRFTAGIMLDILRIGKREHVSFRNEWQILGYRSKVEDYMINHGQFYDFQRVSFDLTYLKMNNLLCFKVIDRSIDLYLQLGPTNGILLTSESSRFRESNMYAGVVTSEREALDQFKKLESGIAFGLGSTFKNFGIDLRFESTSGFSPYRNLRTAVNRVQVLCSYRF